VGVGAIAIQSVNEHFVKARLGLEDPLLAAQSSGRRGREWRLHPGDVNERTRGVRTAERTGPEAP
jgi:hypothetical protein